MALFIGILGLPNVGKSTLFNALTAGSAVASNYPFATVDPNVGVVDVPDARLRRLAELLQPASCTPTSQAWSAALAAARAWGTGSSPRSARPTP